MKKIIKHHQNNISHKIKLSKQSVWLLEQVRKKIQMLFLCKDKVPHSDAPFFEVKHKVIRSKDVWFSRNIKGKWKRVSYDTYAAYSGSIKGSNQ
jgi:hypothetical protein